MIVLPMRQPAIHTEGLTKVYTVSERESGVATALLHRPQVVFLDEPTIGLDVTMQRRIRTFFAEYNQRFGATLLLTSHYMNDVEALCRRVIVIHEGRLLFDGDLSSLVQRFTSHKTIVVQLETCPDELQGYGEVVSCEDGLVTLRVPKAETPRVTARLLADLYRAEFRTSLATMFQYRASLVIWLISQVLDPVIYLIVWSTVAEAGGR